MLVRELVGGEVVSIAPSATLVDGANMMISASVGALAVEVDGALEGIFTERDVLRAAADDADFSRETVGEWMTDYPDSFDPDMPVADAANWLLASGYRHLPLVENGATVGMVSIKDILWALSEPSSV